MEFQNRNDQNRIFMFRFQWEGEGRVQQLAEMRLCTMKGPQGSSAHILLGRPRKNEVENHVKSSAFTFNCNILLSLYLSLSLSLCIYIYICVCVCVCMCADTYRPPQWLGQLDHQRSASVTDPLSSQMGMVWGGRVGRRPHVEICSWACRP